MKCTITLHMVASLDGFIAKPDNSIGWFETTSPYENGTTGGNPEEILKTIDCYIMGAKTYELGIQLAKNYGWPYGETPTIVITHRTLPSINNKIQFYSGDLVQLVDQQLKPNYKNVWLVGGADLARSFLAAKLVDEIRMPILPILLGEGLRFFEGPGTEQPLHLKDVKAYKNGMVDLLYEIRK